MCGASQGNAARPFDERARRRTAWVLRDSNESWRAHVVLARYRALQHVRRPRLDPEFELPRQLGGAVPVVDNVAFEGDQVPVDAAQR